MRSPQRPHSTRPCNKDRKSTRLNSSHTVISYAVFCLKKKNNTKIEIGSKIIKADHPPVLAQDEEDGSEREATGAKEGGCVKNGVWERRATSHTRVDTT